ncbi:MAG: FAD-dependent oxidoreductase, partial [Pseudomonadota bacterium]|nr:FAD-dependent oxidoreductase [Pseudomonadota bacterium]
MEAYQTAVDAALASQLRAPLGQCGAAALIDEWFETAELRTLLYLLASEYGAALRQPGGDLGFAGLVLWMLGGREVPVGGMQSLADALQRAAQQAGVEVRAATPVRRLLIESGRVVGVEAGAQALRATHVISSIDLAQTFGALLGDDAEACVDAETRAALLARPGPSIASQAFALRAPPDYRSARWDADLNRCVQTYVGFNTPEDVLTHERDLTLGLLPPGLIDN